jgi:hypothetical protein
MAPQISRAALLIPRVTDMRNGFFRPEVVIGDGSMSDIAFLQPMASADEAWERACDAIELVPGDWADNGLWYACP